MMKNLILFLALGLPGPALLAAQTVDESRPFDLDGQISFTAVTGSFEFVGSSDDRLHISGTLGEDVETMVIEGHRGHWQVELKPHDHRSRGERGGQSSRLVISVPRGVELEARTISAGMSVMDLEGHWVNLHSISGDIVLNNVQPERLNVETVSGGHNLDAGGWGESRLKSVSGNIQAHGLVGRIAASSVSGQVDVEAVDIEDADLETVSGRIEASLVPAERARINLASHSGPLNLKLPAETPLDLRANTFSGRISSGFGGEVQRGHGPGQRLSHRTGSGQVRVQAQSFSGRIQIESLD
jgi:hypothetical protein